MSLRIRPLTLKQANDAIRQWHRHHKPVVGHRWSSAAYDGAELVGVCVVGRPVAREVPQYSVAEVTRLATNGHRNACSFLYSAAARIAREMGFDKIQTYILDSEPGISLLASGWTREVESAGGDWNRGGESTHKNRRTDTPMCPKVRWAKVLA